MARCRPSFRKAAHAALAWCACAILLPSYAAAQSAAAQPQPAPATESARRTVLREIGAITGEQALPADFVLEETQDARARSLRRGEQRVIQYSAALVEQLRDNENKWIARLLLAHEVGHHYLGHTMQKIDPVLHAERELLADRYSGQAIARMGGTYEQLKAGFMSYHETGKNGYPPRDERLAAGYSGWLAVNMPKESLTMTAGGKPGGQAALWRKSGIRWTEVIGDQEMRLFDERMRSDDYMTLSNVGTQDEGESGAILMVPLANGEVLGRSADSGNRVYTPVASVTWLSRPAPSVAAAVPLEHEPGPLVVPVSCAEPIPSGENCKATRQEKIAIRSIATGRWRQAWMTTLPTDWRDREDITVGATLVMPGSTSLLARHNFKMTVSAGAGTNYATLAELRRQGEDTGLDDAPPLLPPADDAGDQANEGHAQATGQLRVPGEQHADANGNYVAFRYLVYRNGRICPEDGGAGKPACGKAATLEGYRPIEKSGNAWKTTVSYLLMDEKTAPGSEPTYSVDLGCSARQTLSMEAFSATCQLLWEAMTRDERWVASLILPDSALQESAQD